MSSRYVSIALAALAVASPAAAKPPHNDHAPVSAAQIAGAVADPTREPANRALDAGRMPDAMLAFAKLRRGDVVADWGAGSGYYSEMLADAVGPRGIVYAIGVAANYDAKAWAPVLAHHDNIRPLYVPGEAESLAPASLDAIFAHLEYHDLYWSSAKYHYPVRDVDAVLRNWFAALRPGGRVVVIDHAATGGDPRETADKFHRIDPARVRADFARAGFVLDGESTALHREDDPRTAVVFDPKVRGHTDRFAMRFIKPQR
ncbi:class I SAM-dependent methyltransferase [Novosphingobium sp.]|uniref:class I SAM-dependent methyltransferase n=1 Tax=Novosphingobium sp. TaxID=1874826 RepID=UPI003D0DF01D